MKNVRGKAGERAGRTLNLAGLNARLSQRLPDYPPELIKAATAELLGALTEALSQGQAISLRGFGRWQPRFYASGPKKLGLIFRPSPLLTARLRRSAAEGEEAEVSDYDA